MNIHIIFYLTLHIYMSNFIFLITSLLYLKYHYCCHFLIFKLHLTTLFIFDKNSPFYLYTVTSKNKLEEFYLSPFL